MATKTYTAFINKLMSLFKQKSIFSITKSAIVFMLNIILKQNWFLFSNDNLFHYLMQQPHFQ